MTCTATAWKGPEGHSFAADAVCSVKGDHATHPATGEDIHITKRDKTRFIGTGLESRVLVVRGGGVEVAA